MKTVLLVIGGVLIGGFAASQVSDDLAVLGVIGGGAIGAVLALRQGAKGKTGEDGGVWYDGNEQDDDDDDWGGDDGGDGGD